MAPVEHPADDPAEDPERDDEDQEPLHRRSEVAQREIAKLLGEEDDHGSDGASRDETERSARQMFAFSLVYLSLIFMLLLVDHGIGHAFGGVQ